MKTVRLVLVASFVLLLEGLSVAWQASVPGAGFRSSFQAEYPNAEIIWNHYSGEVSGISGMQINGFSGSPADVGEQALRAYHELLGLPGEGISFIRMTQRETRAGGQRILFQTVQKGNPIKGARFLVGVNRPFEGRPFYIDARGNVAPPGYHFQRLGERDYDQPREDWYVHFVERSAINRKEDVPAKAALTRASTAVRDVETHVGTDPDDPYSACPNDDFSFIGSGQAYLTNPLNADLQTVQLTNLCNQIPITLEGKRVRVETWSGEVLSDPDGRFIHQPESMEFENVSVYYHINNFVSMMMDRGFDPLIAGDWSITAYTRSTNTNSAVSRYKQKKIEFGLPEPPFQNAVYEAATIAHEVTHNLMYDYVSGEYFGWGQKENFELGEAYADYFGLVYRSHQQGHDRSWEQPIIGNYLSPVLTRDLPRDLSLREPHYSGRDFSNYVGTPDLVTSLNMYDNSVIFSSALMHFDRIDGSVNSSAFVIESLFNITGTPNYEKGRNALVVAANNCALGEDPGIVLCCESNKCAGKVKLAFEQNGIGVSDTSTSNESQAEKNATVPSAPFRLNSAFPNPFRTRARIDFDVINPAHVHISVYDALGRYVTTLLDEYVVPGKQFVDWSPGDETGGAYFFEIVADDHVERGSMILLK